MKFIEKQNKTLTQPKVAASDGTLYVSVDVNKEACWREGPAFLGTAVIQFAMVALGVITGIVTGRLLGPQGRGELAAITLWPTIFVFVASLGLNQAVVFHTGKRLHSLSEVWTASVVLGIVESLLVVVVGLVLMPVLFRQYSANSQRLGVIFLMATPALFLGGLSANLFQGKGDLFRFNLIRMIAPGCYAIGLPVLLLLRRCSLQAILGTQIVGYIAALIVGLGLLYHCEKPTFLWRAHAGKDLLSYGVRSHLTNLTSYFNQRVDQLILSLLVPAQELGLYAVAVSLAMSVNFFPTAVGMVTFSHGSRQSEFDARQTIIHSFQSSLLWLLVGCFGLYFAAPILIIKFLGPKFAGSIIACRLLLPGMVALGLNQVLYGGANAMGKPSLPLYAEGFGLTVTAVGLILLVPHYGYVGAAIVSTFAYTISFAVMLVLSISFMRLKLRELFVSPRQAITKRPEVISA